MKRLKPPNGIAQIVAKPDSRPGTLNGQWPRDTWLRQRLKLVRERDELNDESRNFAGAELYNMWKANI